MRLRTCLLASLAPAFVGGCATVSSDTIGETWKHPGPGQLTQVTQDAPLIEFRDDCPDSADPCEKPPAAAPAASADSSAGGPRPKAANIGNGIAYFLPRQLARVTVKRSSKTLADKIGDVGKKQLALTAANAAHAAAEADLVQVTQALAKNPEDARIRDLLLEERTRIIKRRDDAKKAAEDAAKAHQAAIDAVTAMKVDTVGNDITVLVELLPPSADPNYGFRLSPQHNVFRDDEQKIEITAAGLLTSTDITATDRTGDFLVELAGIAGAALAVAKDAGGSPCTMPEQVISIVDLTNEADMARLASDLRCMRVKLSVAGSPGEQVKPLSLTAPAQGIFYRTPIEVPVRIEHCPDQCAAGDWVLREVRYLPLPQAGPISMLPQNAGIMTKTRYQLGFKDGILVKYDASRPSEAIRIAETPMRMIDSFFGGISKVISLRTGYNDELSEMSASDLARLQSLARNEAVLDEFEKCAAEKRAAGNSILPCLPEEEE